MVWGAVGNCYDSTLHQREEKVAKTVNKESLCQTTLLGLFSMNYVKGYAYLSSNINVMPDKVF